MSLNTAALTECPSG